MFGLKERHYPGRVLNNFWCDSDIKNFIHVLYNFRRYFRFPHFGYHQNLVI